MAEIIVDDEKIETRESILEDAVAGAEAGLDSTVEGTEGTDPNVAELRAELGEVADGLTDEELLAEVAKANEPEAFALPNGLKLYGEDGKEVSDYSKITLQQLLSDKVQWGYNALGKEQKKALTEVFRNASLGHYNEQKMQTLAQERAKAYEMYKTMSTEHEAWAKDRQVWLSVLTSAAQGNVEPLKALIKKYGEVSSEAGVGAAAPVDATQESEWDQKGMEWVTSEANRIAEQYGANPLEIAQAIVYLANQEPQEFLTQDKLNAIVQYEIPALLERYKYSAKNGGAATPDPRDAKVAEMEKQIAELTADKKNTQVQNLRNKIKKIPAAGGGRTTGAGDAVPTFKNRESYKRWIRDEPEE